MHAFGEGAPLPAPHDQPIALYPSASVLFRPDPASLITM